MTVHLLLSAGRGPRECAWAVAQLTRRLESSARGLTVTRVESVPGERPGTYLSILLRVEGDEAAAFAAGWTGTLCWQAASPYRKAGRKNWYVISQIVESGTSEVSFREGDVDFVPCRTGGPGGQHRNKASTAMRATHRPTGSTVVVDTERQLSQNRRLAVELLRRRIAEGNEASARAAVMAKWQIHDDLVRGNPTRVERPS
jgi:peptide chain release factor